jgi:ATP-binding cassette subfamily B protein
VRAWLSTGRLLVGIGWEVGPAVFLLYTAVTTSAFIGPLLLAFGIRPLVDGVVFGAPERIAVGGAAVGAALLLAVLAPVGYRWATIRMRERATMVMQRRVLALSAGAPQIEHFERPAFLDRLQALRRGAQELALSVTLPFVGPIVVVQLLATVLLLARLQPVLGLLPVVALPSLGLSRKAESIRRQAELDTAEERRGAQHLFTLASAASAAQEVRTYGLGAELLRRHRRASDAAHRALHTALFRSVAVSAAGWALFPLAYVAAVLLVVRETVAGRATPGDVAQTLTLASAVVNAAGRVLDLASSTLRIRTTTEHYSWLSDQANATSGRTPPPARLERGIDLENVTFGYGDGDRQALPGTSLHLPAGTTVAVVGENGAGKTTLVKLLSGMYRPTSGRILVDGVDLAAIDLEAYRLRLTAGFQDFVRFELKVREAVAIGDLGTAADGVQAALTKAGASFVDHLRAGVDTQLGAAWQEGVDISGGEWQKLALARAFMRREPLLVVMDEPSASLDPQTEYALFEQLAANARDGRADGRITLLISHRFSTVRAADLIVVLDRGAVVEQGSHEDLVALGGTYAELYKLQADAYR